MERMRAQGAGSRGSGAGASGGGPSARHPAPSVVDAIVIGGGPAGLAAAVQLVRQGVRTVLFEKSGPGGQINTANRVENYLGLPGLKGKEMARRFILHAKRAGVTIVREEVLEVIVGEGFTVRTPARQYVVKAVIVATGGRPREIEGLDKRLVEKIRYDTDDIAAFRGKSTLLLGGGDATFDRALRLKGVCSELRILSRGSFSALPKLVSECRLAGVKMVQNVGRWNVTPRNGGIVVTTDKGVFLADMVLASLGKEQKSSILPTSVERLAPAFPTGETNVPGLYVIGDLAAGRYRQLAVATGMGVASSMHAAEFLKRVHGITVEESPRWK